MNPVCPTFLSIHSVLYPIFTARQRSWGKVMFSVVSVQRGGFPCGYYSWCIGPHCTDSLDMRPHWMGTPDPALAPLDMGPHWTGTPSLGPPQTWDLNEHGSPSSPPLVTSSGHQGRPFQTCSLLDTHLLVLTAGGYWRLGQWKWVVRILLECFLAVIASCRNLSVQNDLFTGLPGQKITVTFYKIKTNSL